MSRRWAVAGSQRAWRTSFHISPRDAPPDITKRRRSAGDGRGAIETRCSPISSHVAVQGSAGVSGALPRRAEPSGLGQPDHRAGRRSRPQGRPDRTPRAPGRLAQLLSPHRGLVTNQVLPRRGDTARPPRQTAILSAGDGVATYGRRSIAIDCEHHPDRLVNEQMPRPRFFTSRLFMPIEISNENGVAANKFRNSGWVVRKIKLCKNAIRISNSHLFRGANRFINERV